MNGGATIIDFLENALEQSAGDLVEIASVNPAVLLARRESFFAALETSWSNQDLMSLAPAEPDQLRPIYARGLLSRHGVLSSYYADSPAHAAAAREVKALLLYAHGTVVVNPLAPWFSVADTAIVREGRPAGLAFVRAIQTLAELADLVRAGTVSVLDPPVIEVDDSVDVEAALRGHGGEQFLRAAGWDQWEAHGRSRDMLGQLLALAIVDPDDRASALAASPDLEGAAICDLVTKVVEALQPGRELPTEHARLASLMQLSLPGVDQLAATDMSTVRRDNRFMTFRDDMRAALVHADRALEAGDLVAARNEVQEHMAARAAELTQSRASTRFWSATASGVIGWSVGAAINGLEGWKAALLSVVARGAYDAAKTRPGAGQSALLQHYVALSQAASSDAGGSPAERIRAWRQSSRG